MKKLTRKEIMDNYEEIEGSFISNYHPDDIAYQVWSEDLTEIFREKIKEKGFENIDDIRWRFSYSQGDGVAFYGNVELDITDELVLEALDGYYSSLIEYAKKENLSLDYITGCKIVKTNSHYNHYNTMMNDFVEEGDIKYFIEKVVENILLKDIQEIRKDLYFIMEDWELVDEYIQEAKNDDDFDLLVSYLSYDLDYEKIGEYILEDLKYLSKKFKKFGYNYLEDRAREQARYRLKELLEEDKLTVYKDRRWYKFKEIAVKELV